MRLFFGGVLGRLGQIGADPRDDEDTRQRKALLVLISVLILPIAVVWGSLYLAFGSPVGYVPFLYVAVLLAAIGIFARTRDAAFLLRVNLIDIVLAPTLSMIPLGGFQPAGAVGLWGILAPMGALVFGGARSGIRWFAAFLVIFLGSGILGAVVGPVSSLPAWFTTIMLALNVTVGGTFAFALLAVFANQLQEALTALRGAQEQAESLLLNVLPKSIADKLKAEPQTIADQFGAASILFADVVDFTPRAEHLPPGEVVGLLDNLFSHFDTLAERYGLEKIKTIGDCYMVAAGVPTPRADHAQALAMLALDMLQAVRAGEAVGDLGLELRIGINSGPVVAGVIGRKRFLYDLWGDAVNIASRMESHGTPGHIQITKATRELLEEAFVIEPRGTVSVKGKGDMETWYLVGPRTNAASVAERLIPPAPATEVRPTTAETEVVSSTG
jgi:adenylate cyclase